MESVTELFPGKDKRHYRTRVYATEQGHKDYANIKHRQQAISFENRAESGFEGYINPAMIRKEGEGVWAFGKPKHTSRIAIIFDAEPSRRKCVVVGVWDGKPGSGGRPPSAEAIVRRAEVLKVQGVKYVDSTEAGSAASRPEQDREGQVSVPGDWTS